MPRRQPAAATCRSRHWAQVPITARSWNISASPRSTWASAARTTTRASITRAMTRSTTTRASAIPPSSTAWRWPRWPATSCCAAPMPICCRCASAISARPWAAMSANCTSWSTRHARRRRNSTSCSTHMPTRWTATRPGRCCRRRATPTCRRSSWPRWTAPPASWSRARRLSRRPTRDRPPTALPCPRHACASSTGRWAGWNRR